MWLAVAWSFSRPARDDSALTASSPAACDGFSATSETATIARSRLAARPGIKDEMMAAGQGLALAHLQYQLDRYPAIVFDGTRVIYGVTDLAAARRLYERRR